MAAVLAVTLAACSGGGSGLERTAGESQTRVDPDSAVPDAAPERAPDSEDTAQQPAGGVDHSIEAFVDEIPERIQRDWDSALAAMRAQNRVQAQLEFEEIIAEEPGLPGPYVNLALIYKRENRLAEARTALEQAVAIAPQFPPANNELGLLLRESGEFAAAEAAYLRTLSADPANAIAHLNLGILLDLYLQRPGDALDHYNQYQATRVEPDEVVARWIVDLERRVSAAGRVAQD